MNSLLATLLSGSGNNFDYTYSIAAEVGMIEQSDYDWNLASSWQSSTGGLRLGYQVNDNVDMLASIHWGTQGNDTYDYYYDYEYDEAYSSGMSGYEIQVSETQVHVGPKFSWNLKPWFAPYATAQALMVHNRLQMSDNGLFDEAANTLIDASGVGFGATAAVGMEFRLRPIAKKSQLFFYGEAGTTGTTAVNFAMEGAGTGDTDINIGDLDYGGGYFRLGAGTKF
jgi:hypothetical protein